MTNQRCILLLCIISMMICTAPIHGSQDQSYSKYALVMGGFAAGALTMWAGQNIFRKNAVDRRLELHREMFEIVKSGALAHTLIDYCDYHTETIVKKIIDERLQGYDKNLQKSLRGLRKSRKRDDRKESKQGASPDASDSNADDSSSSSDGDQDGLISNVVHGTLAAYGRNLAISVCDANGVQQPILGPWPEPCYPAGRAASSSSSSSSSSSALITYAASSS